MSYDVFPPVQSTGLSADGVIRRQLRRWLFAAAGVALALAWFAIVSRPAAPRVCCMEDSDYLALCRSGHPAEAVAAIDRELNSPTFSGCPFRAARLHFLRGGALRLMGQPTLGEADYLAAYNLAAPYLGEDARMAWLDATGPSPEGRDLALQMIHERPYPTSTLNNACWQLVISGSADRVAELDAVAESSSRPEVIDTEAWMLYLSGDRSRAVQVEQRAVSLAENSDVLQRDYFLACLEGMQGNREQARVDLLDLYQRDITFTSAWQAARLFAN